MPIPAMVAVGIYTGPLGPIQPFEPWPRSPEPMPDGLTLIEQAEWKAKQPRDPQGASAFNPTIDAVRMRIYRRFKGLR